MECETAEPPAPGVQGFQARMREEQHQFLSLLGQLPARLTAEQAAWVLNCQPHDVPILVSSRLPRLLGNPPANPSAVGHMVFSGAPPAAVT